MGQNSHTYSWFMKKRGGRRMYEYMGLIVDGHDCVGRAKGFAELELDRQLGESSRRRPDQECASSNPRIIMASE